MIAIEIDLWQKLKDTEGDEHIAVRNQLAEQNLKLVHAVARKYAARAPKNIDIQDLVNDGLFGLLDAIESFDPGRGIKFSTYAPRRIMGAIIDAIRGLDWVPRLERARKTEFPTISSIDKSVDMGGHADVHLRDVLVAPEEQMPLDVADLVKRLLRRLPPINRAIFEMIHRDGLTMKEAGKRLGITESRVSQLHTRSQKKLARQRRSMENEKDHFYSRV